MSANETHETPEVVGEATFDEVVDKGVAAVVARHDYPNAETLLANLEPSTWLDPAAWVFRGQSRVELPLIASAHRPEAWNSYVPDSLEQMPIEGSGDMGIMDPKAEADILLRFFRAVDAAGLPIPQSTLEPPRHSSGEYGSEPWLRRQYFPFLALAQHHQIPTRLLDWTAKPKVAAYFAARNARKHPEPGYMVVWALRADFIDEWGNEAAPPNSAVEIVRVPRASNQNLHAQAGLFTLLHAFKVWPLDHFLRAFIQEPAAARWASENRVPIMHKFLLPRTEAAALLRLLADDDITAAAAFPGYDGVALSLRELGTSPRKAEGR